MCFVLLYIYKAMLHDVFYAFVHVQSFENNSIYCFVIVQKIKKQMNLYLCTVIKCFAC